MQKLNVSGEELVNGERKRRTGALLDESASSKATPFQTKLLEDLQLKFKQFKLDTKKKYHDDLQRRIQKT